MRKLKENNCEILIPEDCLVGISFDGEGKNKKFGRYKRK